MKKLLLTFCFTFYIFEFTVGQPTFSKRYNLPLLFAKLINAAPDGGYYFCGGMNSDIIVGKIDSSGNLDWAKQIGDASIQDLPYDMVVLNNGNVVACFRWLNPSTSAIQCYVVSFDVAGNLTFLKRYANADPGSDNWPNNIIKDDDGFCLNVANYPENEIRLLKADSLGNKLDGITYDSNTQYVFKTSSGFYFTYQFFGTLISYFTSNFGYIASFNSQLSLGFPLNYGLLELANGYMVYGDNDPPGFVAKINSNLQYEWVKYYHFSPAGPQGKIAAAQKTGDNKITFFGQGEINATKPYIFEIDTLGNVLSCKVIKKKGLNPDGAPNKFVYKNNQFAFIYNETIPLGNFFKISSVDSTFSQLCNAVDDTMHFWNDGIVATSQHYYPFTEPLMDSLVNDTLPVVDITFSYGDCNDSTLFINQFENPGIKLNIFPNPATDFINISLPSSEKNVSIEIYDLYGREVLKRKLQTSNVKLQAQIDISGFKNGIYTVEIKAGKNIFRKKIIKIYRSS